MGNFETRQRPAKLPKASHIFKAAVATSDVASLASLGSGDSRPASALLTLEMVQQPNFLGAVEDLDAVTAQAAAHDAVCVTVHEVIGRVGGGAQRQGRRRDGGANRRLHLPSPSSPSPRAPLSEATAALDT